MSGDNLNNITILGFALPQQTPYVGENDELWSLNVGWQLPWLDMTKVSRWFEMHRPVKLYSDKFAPIHIPWLQQEHPFPIYMVDKFPEFPSSVKYPLEEVTRTLLGGRILRNFDVQENYFSCSFAYMLALAILERPTYITVLGIEMLAPREAWMEAPGVEFWLGVAVANGIHIRLHPQSRLLWRHLYGYEKRKPAPWTPKDVAFEIVLDSLVLDWDTTPSFYAPSTGTVPAVDYAKDSGGVRKDGT